MKPKFLVEKDIFEEDLTEFTDAITACGYEYKIDNYVPFEGGKTKELFPPHACVIAHCSLQMAAHIQKTCSWIPGVFYNVKNYECTTYFNTFGKYLLNSQYIMLPYGELIRQKQFLMDTFANGNCLFMRPNSGKKIFTGTVVDCAEYNRVIERLGFYEVTNRDLVVVAEPRNIFREWRLVIAKNRVVASSLYKERGEHVQEEGCPKDVVDYVNGITEGNWEPDLAWTLDVCETSQGLHILEIGSVSCSGLYKCNKKEIVQAVAEAASEDWAAVHLDPG